MLTLSLAVEGEASPNRGEKNPARKKTQGFSLGLVMSWNGRQLCRCNSLICVSPLQARQQELQLKLKSAQTYYLVLEKTQSPP